MGHWISSGGKWLELFDKRRQFRVSGFRLIAEPADIFRELIGFPLFAIIGRIVVKLRRVRLRISRRERRRIEGESLHFVNSFFANRQIASGTDASLAEIQSMSLISGDVIVICDALFMHFSSTAIDAAGSVE